MFRYIHDSVEYRLPNPLWTAGASFPTLQTNFKRPVGRNGGPPDHGLLATLLNEFVASYTTDHINLTLIGPRAATLHNGMGTVSQRGRRQGGRNQPGRRRVQWPFRDPGLHPQWPIEFESYLQLPRQPHQDRRKAPTCSLAVTSRRRRKTKFLTRPFNQRLPYVRRYNSTVSTGNSFADL